MPNFNDIAQDKVANWLRGGKITDRSKLQGEPLFNGDKINRNLLSPKAQQYMKTMDDLKKRAAALQMMKQRAGQQFAQAENALGQAYNQMRTKGKPKGVFPMEGQP